VAIVMVCPPRRVLHMRKNVMHVLSLCCAWGSYSVFRALSSVRGDVLSVRRALLSVRRALLSVRKALLSVFGTLLSICRALLSIRGALLSVFREHTASTVSFSCASSLLAAACSVVVVVSVHASRSFPERSRRFLSSAISLRRARISCSCVVISEQISCVRSSSHTT